MHIVAGADMHPTHVSPGLACILGRASAGIAISRNVFSVA